MKKISASSNPVAIKKLFLYQFLLASCLACSGAEFPPVSELPLRHDTPNPLVMLDGTPVTTKKQWFKKRRPELLGLFQHYEYGWMPEPVDVTGKVTYVDTNFFKGRATLKLETLTLGQGPRPVVHLLVVIPNNRPGPAPVFIGMNYSGNHTLVPDTNIPVPDAWMPSNIPKYDHVVHNRATADGRGKEIETWPLEEIVERGYAVVTYYCGDVEQDRTNAADGVREIIQAPCAPDGWSTLAAWAWGMERVMDYVSKDRELDQKRMALIGQSRFGKATMVAGAFDERPALIVALQAGCGGTAPSRSTAGESVKQINRFPDWFCQVFHEFNDQVERLPFDQNCLIALCAPRPLLVGAAVQDSWTNPGGTFEMLQSASAVYRLTGAEGLSARTMPATNRLIDSNPGFFIRPGPHSQSRVDWGFILDYADKYLPYAHQ